jgi:hypothetical protein
LVSADADEDRALEHHVIAIQPRSLYTSQHPVKKLREHRPQIIQIHRARL